ncbi:anthranilate/aminodeoxychorismate synthase component II [Aliifodinibius salipaludis]|uniref:Anthranilate/aminodeoxychorismate synthase component II n=1 Tax=Fodinibius salipaludis TaxID=2032627 RepID=A0A2A2GAW1_9BACT|nr:aminodeoxychorismate/anthranilate synthase component II [Aliifodinibius salipaludis]PAU93979.1 anthranilate/aminodeoxychorismate synthase component II [Aliifodinibius salipaludis]
MILIIDNYDSFTYNLVHIVAEYTDDYRVIRNDDLTVEQVKELNPDRILISPGPGRPADAGITEPIIKELGHETPILGVCLGHQAIGEVFGGKVIHAPKLMHGKTSAIKHDGKSVFGNIPDNFTATRYHSLVLDPDSIPCELEISAHSDDQVIMGLRHREYPLEGIQFHPESILTTEGPNIIKNWLALKYEIAK